MKLNDSQIDELVKELNIFANSEFANLSHVINDRMCKAFLKAKSFKISEAKLALKNYLDFQNHMINNPSKYMNMPFNRYMELHSVFSECFYETDNDGNVLQYVSFEKMNLEEIFLIHEVDEIIDFVVYRIEQFWRVIVPSLENCILGCDR